MANFQNPQDIVFGSYPEGQEKVGQDSLAVLPFYLLGVWWAGRGKK